MTIDNITVTDKITVDDMQWIATNTQTISHFTKQTLNKDLLENINISLDMQVWELNSKCLELLTHEEWKNSNWFKNNSAQEILNIIKNTVPPQSM